MAWWPLREERGSGTSRSPSRAQPGLQEILFKTRKGLRGEAPPPKGSVTSQHCPKPETSPLKREPLGNISDPKYSTYPKRPPRLSKTCCRCGCLSSESEVQQHPHAAPWCWPQSLMPWARLGTVVEPGAVFFSYLSLSCQSIICSSFYFLTVRLSLPDWRRFQFHSEIRAFERLRDLLVWIWPVLQKFLKPR